MSTLSFIYFNIIPAGIRDASADDRVDEDIEDDDEKQETAASATSSSADDVPKLNVSEKDSPYALISKFFPNRERNHRRMQNEFEKSYINGQLSREQVGSIGDLGPEEVWLSEGNLLVLKGGSSNDRGGFVDPWEPLDDFQAPYREPKLPPPDFIPTENGVGVPLPPEDEVEDDPRTGIDFFRSKELKQQIEEEEKEKEEERKVKEELTFKQNIIPDEEATPERLRNFVFPEFFNEEKYINEMENFHSIRHAQYLASKLANAARLKPSKVIPPPTSKPTYFVTTTTPESYSYAYISTTPAPPIVRATSPRPQPESRPVTTPRPYNIVTPSPRPKKYKHYPIQSSSPKTVPIPASYKQRRLPTPRPRLTFLSEQQQQQEEPPRQPQQAPQVTTTAMPAVVSSSSSSSSSSSTPYNHNTEISPAFLRQLTTPKSFFPISNSIHDSAVDDKRLFYPAVKSSKYLIKSLAKEYAGRAVKSVPNVSNSHALSVALSNEIDGGEEHLFHAIQNPHKQRQIPPPPPPPPHKSHRVPKKAHFAQVPQQKHLYNHHHQQQHHHKPQLIQPRSRIFKPNPRRRISYTGGPPKPSEVRSLPTGSQRYPQQQQHQQQHQLKQYQSPSETYANFVAPTLFPQANIGVAPPPVSLASNGVRRADSERYVSFYRGSVGGRSWGYSYRL